MYGDTPPPTPPQNSVFLSHPDYTFEFEFSALVLQPTGSDLHYAAEAVPLPIPSPNWLIYDIDPSYDFGFDIGLGGVFRNTNTNLRVNWEHFHSSDTASISVPAADMLGPFFEIGPDAAPYTKAHGRVTFHFDAANLDYGIFLNLGDRLQTNLFGGVGFAYIHQTLLSEFSNVSEGIYRSIETPSSFTGAGPQVGLDFSYRVVDGFNFTGGAMVSLLVGALRNHTSYVSNTPFLPFDGVHNPNGQEINVSNRTQVVPGMEGKLGLSYVLNFGDHYMFRIEAGYQAQIYLNAIQSVDIGSEVIDLDVPDASIGVFARTFQRTLSDFALAGPYATISFGF